MHSFVVLASFVASVFAIRITSPVDGALWSVAGPNEVTWTSVSTDPEVFKMVLVNPDGSVTQELAAQVTTSLGALLVNAPSSGFPLGPEWQVNFVGATAEEPGILAQSGTFNITVNGNATSITTSSSLPMPMSSANIAVTSATGPATTSASTSNTNSNGAAGVAKASGALMGAASLLFLFLF